MHFWQIYWPWDVMTARAQLHGNKAPCLNFCLETSLWNMLRLNIAAALSICLSHLESSPPHNLHTGWTAKREASVSSKLASRSVRRHRGQDQNINHESPPPVQRSWENLCWSGGKQKQSIWQSTALDTLQKNLAKLGVGGESAAFLRPLLASESSRALNSCSVSHEITWNTVKRTTWITELEAQPIFKVYIAPYCPKPIPKNSSRMAASNCCFSNLSWFEASKAALARLSCTARWPFYFESTFSPRLKLDFQTTTKPFCEPRQGPKI